MKKFALTAGTAALLTAGTLSAPTAANAAFQAFSSPSGNIGCYISGGYARCDIRDRDWTPPPRPADCNRHTSYGQGLFVRTHGQPDVVCAGDTALTVENPLAYGSSVTVEGITCLSQESGMRCTNTDGRGFDMSRQGYRFF